jgi:alpha-galactosidase
MPRITMIEAGSTVIAQNLISDILSFPELTESTFSLHDLAPMPARPSLKPKALLTEVPHAY